MMNKFYLTTKQKLIQASYYCGLTRLLHYGWFAGKYDGTVLVYHSIGDEEDLSFIPSQMQVPVARFEQHMAFVSQNCHIISLSSLGKAVEKRSRMPFRTVALTFDDGFKNNLTNVLPVLLRYGLTATFFIVTDWVESQQLSWLHRLYYLSGVIPAEELVDRFSDELPQRKDSRGVDIGSLNRYGFVRTLYSFMLGNLTMSETEAVIDVVWKKTSVMSTEKENILAKNLYFSWDDVDQLVRAGMDIGSHTAWHLRMPRRMWISLFVREWI